MDAKASVRRSFSERVGRVDSPPVAKSPLRRVESRSRLGQRSSLSLATTATVELVVSDPDLDEQTVRQLSAMAINEQKKADLRRSFVAGKKARLSGGSSGSLTGAGPRRRSFEIDTVPLRERSRASSLIPSSLISPIGRVSSHTASRVQECPQHHEMDDADGVVSGSGPACPPVVRRSLSDGVAHSSYNTHSMTSNATMMTSPSPSHDVTTGAVDNMHDTHSKVASNGSDYCADAAAASVSTDTMQVSSPNEQLYEERQSSVGECVGFHAVASKVSPIPECSSEGSASSSPCVSTPVPPAPPLPRTVADSFDADSSQGVPHRRKTITVVDESQVELDEALDVIREQEDEIALLQYQVEDLKDRFEMLEMTANESEQLLHQAVDSGARLKHLDRQRSAELDRYRLMESFLEQVLARFEVPLPSIDLLRNEEDHLQQLDNTEVMLQEAIHSKTSADGQVNLSGIQRPLSRSDASSGLSLPAAIMSRVRTPDWFRGDSNRSPSPKPNLRLSRESSVDPPRSRSDASSPIRFGSPARSMGTPVERGPARLSAIDMAVVETKTKRGVRRVRHSSVDPPIGASLSATSGESSGPERNLVNPEANLASIAHDHHYSHKEPQTPSAATSSVSHDHAYTIRDNPPPNLAFATTEAVGASSVPAMLTGIQMRNVSGHEHDEPDGMAVNDVMSHDAVTHTRVHRISPNLSVPDDSLEARVTQTAPSQYTMRNDATDTGQTVTALTPRQPLPQAGRAKPPPPVRKESVRKSREEHHTVPQPSHVLETSNRGHRSGNGVLPHTIVHRQTATIEPHRLSSIHRDSPLARPTPNTAYPSASLTSDGYCESPASMDPSSDISTSYRESPASMDPSNDILASNREAPTSMNHSNFIPGSYSEGPTSTNPSDQHAGRLLRNTVGPSTVSDSYKARGIPHRSVSPFARRGPSVHGTNPYVQLRRTQLAESADNVSTQSLETQV